MRIFKFALLVYITINTVAIADPDGHDLEFTQHQAHQHGSANATVSYSESQVHVVFTLPAADVFGFEHEARNDKQHAKIKSALNTLSDSNNVVSLSVACEISKYQVTQQHEEHASYDEHHDEHFDIEIESQYTCHTNEAITLTINLFDSFPSLRIINIQYASDSHQDLYRIDAKNNTIDIK